MRRFLLDTNIVIDAIKPLPSQHLQEWISRQDEDALFSSSATVAEIYRGILILPAWRRQTALIQWFTGDAGPQALFAGRVLGFDERSAIAWAKLMADSRARGRPRSVLDGMIAAIAVVNDCAVVTANESDFEGMEIINPIRG